MGFQVSPGVNVSEIDLTTIVPAVTTSAGFAGCFRWGPVGERVLVDSPNRLREIFGPPDDNTSNFFFTAYNFLGYGNNLSIVRAFGGSAGNANSLEHRRRFLLRIDHTLTEEHLHRFHPQSLSQSIPVDSETVSLLWSLTIMVELAEQIWVLLLHWALVIHLLVVDSLVVETLLELSLKVIESSLVMVMFTQSRKLFQELLWMVRW